jgi:hypothetical protein
MANLEYVIRPYQTPDVYGRIVIPTSETRADRATLTWGATSSGTPYVAKTKDTTGMTYQFDCCNEGLQEKSRSNHTIRITGSDGESYVDVERPYQMTLKKKTKTQCDGPLDQMSLVNQGINSVLNDFQDAFDQVASEFATTDETDCQAQWKFSG